MVDECVMFLVRERKEILPVQAAPLRQGFGEHHFASGHGLPPEAPEARSGGPRRDRTAGLCSAIAALSQLSYRPISLLCAGFLYHKDAGTQRVADIKKRGHSPRFLSDKDSIPYLTDP